MSVDCSNNIFGGVKGSPLETPSQDQQANDEWEGYGVYPMAPELPAAPDGLRWELLQKLYTDSSGQSYPVFAFKLVPNPQSFKATTGE